MGPLILTWYWIKCISAKISSSPSIDSGRLSSSAYRPLHSFIDKNLCLFHSLLSVCCLDIGASIPLEYHTPSRPRLWSLITANTASAVAPSLYRAQPNESTYRPPSTPVNESRLGEYNAARREEPRGHSPIPPSAAYGKDISRPSSTALPHASSFLFNQPQFHTRSASLSLGRGYHSEPRPALPGLSSLTSLAGAGPPMR